jgi:hypothetical protein
VTLIDPDKHFEHAVTLSRDALRALLIVNGGAAAALVALMDKTDGARDYTLAILWFGAGAVFSVLSACFAYFSQLSYANGVLNGKHPATFEKSVGDHKRHGRWQAIIFVCVLAALICMVLGMWTAAHTASH